MSVFDKLYSLIIFNKEVSQGIRLQGAAPVWIEPDGADCDECDIVFLQGRELFRPVASAFRNVNHLCEGIPAASPLARKRRFFQIITAGRASRSSPSDAPSRKARPQTARCRGCGMHGGRCRNSATAYMRAHRTSPCPCGELAWMMASLIVPVAVPPCVAHEKTGPYGPVPQETHGRPRHSLAAMAPHELRF